MLPGTPSDPGGNMVGSLRLLWMMTYFLNYNHSVTIAKGPVPVINGTAATPPSMDEVNWGARATDTFFYV